MTKHFLKENYERLFKTQLSESTDIFLGKEIPISKLKKLVKLQINRNELKSLPNNICNINFDKDKMQSLEHNTRSHGNNLCRILREQCTNIEVRGCRNGIWSK